MSEVDTAYRPNVGAVLFNAVGLVLIARRADIPRDVAEVSGWQWPQGGIDPGETPQDAVMREVEEELGTRAVRVLAEHDAWLTYDFPPHVRLGGPKQAFRGQRQRWFALRFLGADADIRFDRHGTPEFDAFRWVRLDEVPPLAVAWKRPVYEAVAAAFAPWSTRTVGEHA